MKFIDPSEAMPTVHIRRIALPLPRQFAAITLGSHVFVRKGTEITRALLAHEFTHVLQWHRYGTIGFLFRYGWTWIRDGFSYRRIDLEEEAYEKANLQAHAWADRAYRALKAEGLAP